MIICRPLFAQLFFFEKIPISRFDFGFDSPPCQFLFVLVRKGRNNFWSLHPRPVSSYTRPTSVFVHSLCVLCVLFELQHLSARTGPLEFGDWPETTGLFDTSFSTGSTRRIRDNYSAFDKRAQLAPPAHLCVGHSTKPVDSVYSVCLVFDKTLGS